MGKAKQLLLLFTTVGQLIGLGLLFVQIKLAIIVYAISVILPLVILVILIIERKKEKEEDDRNDYRNY